MDLERQNDLFAQMSLELEQEKQEQNCVAEEEEESNPEAIKNSDDLGSESGKPSILFNDDVREEAIAPRAAPVEIDSKAQIHELVQESSDKTPATTNKRKAPSERMQVSPQQLERFVSVPVPTNKRVLCLIVRDKMSRLSGSNAKTPPSASYFYPNYYLFLQTIVDLDQLSSCCLEKQQRQQQQVLSFTPDGQNSSENSFSASSSISADMLFIGHSQSGASPQAPKQCVNSYSDNETAYDEESAAASGDKISNQETTAEQQVKGKAPRLRARQAPFDGSAGERLEWVKSSELETGSRLSSASSQSNEEDASEPESDCAETTTDQRWANSGTANGGANRNRSASLEDQTLRLLFDQQRNPYTGTYGVLLSGKRRKKAKT